MARKKNGWRGEAARHIALALLCACSGNGGREKDAPSGDRPEEHREAVGAEDDRGWVEIESGWRAKGGDTTQEAGEGGPQAPQAGAGASTAGMGEAGMGAAGEAPSAGSGAAGVGGSAGAAGAPEAGTAGGAAGMGGSGGVDASGVGGVGGFGGAGGTPGCSIARPDLCLGGGSGGMAGSGGAGSSGGGGGSCVTDTPWDCHATACDGTESVDDSDAQPWTPEHPDWAALHQTSSQRCVWSTCVDGEPRRIVAKPDGSYNEDNQVCYTCMDGVAYFGSC